MPTTQTPAYPARLERAQEIIGQGRVSQSRRQPTTYYVSALDNRHAYVVQLEGPSPCNCPDASYQRRHCKHFFAAALVHLGALAMGEERQARNGSTVRQRAAPRRGHPIRYEATPEPASVRCADCGRSDCRGSYKPDGNHGLAF